MAYFRSLTEDQRSPILGDSPAFPTSYDSCRWLQFAHSKGVRNNGSTHREVSSKAKFSFLNWDCRVVTRWHREGNGLSYSYYSRGYERRSQKRDSPGIIRYEILICSDFEFSPAIREQGNRHEDYSLPPIVDHWYYGRNGSVNLGSGLNHETKQFQGIHCGTAYYQLPHHTPHTRNATPATFVDDAFATLVFFSRFCYKIAAASARHPTQSCEFKTACCIRKEASLGSESSVWAESLNHIHGSSKPTYSLMGLLLLQK